MPTAPKILDAPMRTDEHYDFYEGKTFLNNLVKWRVNEKCVAWLAKAFNIDDVHLLPKIGSTLSVEHIFQAFKFCYHGATEATQRYGLIVLCAESPFCAKLLANQKIRSGYHGLTQANDRIETSFRDGVSMDPEWVSSNRITSMMKSLACKAEFHPKFVIELLATGNADIHEHTTRDDVWGDGGRHGKGQDFLGKCLVQLRTELRAQSQ